MTAAKLVSTALPPGQRVVVTEFGDTPTDAMDRFVTLEPQPAPDPAALAPGEVLVAVRSASVGWVDLLMTSGQYQHMPAPPYTPGLEYAGVIAAKGSAAAPGFSVGDEILVDPFLAGPRSLGAYQKSGGWASYAVVPGEAVLRVPGKLSLDAACNLLGNYETAYHCLVARGRLRQDEWVLIHGASGATGLAGSVSLSASGLGFLAGYGADAFFKFADALLARVFALDQSGK